MHMIISWTYILTSIKTKYTVLFIFSSFPLPFFNSSQFPASWLPADSERHHWCRSHSWEPASHHNCCLGDRSTRVHRTTSYDYDGCTRDTCRGGRLWETTEEEREKKKSVRYIEPLLWCKLVGSVGGYRLVSPLQVSSHNISDDSHSIDRVEDKKQQYEVRAINCTEIVWLHTDYAWDCRINIDNVTGPDINNYW